MTELYDLDILEWSEHQARLLRQQAEGRPANERPDWANIIEEVESVGRSELNAVESLLTQALLHDLRCQAWPDSRDVPHWQGEARLFRRQASRKLTPSMRGKIDVLELHADALAALPSAMDGRAAGAVRDACGLTLDKALAGLRS